MQISNEIIKEGDTLNIITPRINNILYNKIC